ncbi:hypothetical protein JCM10450v2_000547 [Rhodotorula kratochvilovae]
MIESLISAAYVGQYDYWAVPVALPTPLVRALLPHSSSPAAPQVDFLTPQEVQTAAVHVPDPGEGHSWVVVEAGKQIRTGVGWVPLGRSTFHEAKLEVPFLRHPQTASAVPVTLKSSLLFSSRLMRFSSTHLTGLRSHRAICIETPDSFEAMDWLRIKVDGEVSVPAAKRWSEETVRSVVAGYWVGENTGASATKFNMTDLTPPRALNQLRVRLNLPAFTQLPIEEVRKLLEGTDLAMEENGWAEIEAAGYALSDETHMQVASLSSL